MAQIAVNVVLLLPENINEICREINSDTASEALCDLNDQKLHPHITLAMGVIDDYNIDKINSVIAEVLKRYSKMNIVVSNKYSVVMPDKKTSSAFTVDISMDLVKLHAELMKDLSEYFSYHVKEYMFDCLFGEKIHEISLKWVEDYGRNHKNPGNFRPHISLYCKNIKFDGYPIKFNVSNVAVCHLGDYCSSKSILSSFNLKE